MGIPMGTMLYNIDIFVLVLIRMAGLFVITPIFGRKNLPTYIKIGFSFMLALILVNTITIPKLDNYDTILGFGLLAVKEFIVGLALGYISYVIFSAIYIAGQIIDMQIGFGVVNVLDPITNIQIPITANFYFILSLLIYMMVDGHHQLIKGLFDSYRMIPIGEAVFSIELMNDIIRLFGNTFIVGFKIAAPMVAATLITDIILGIVSKTVPQLNVFVVGMPLKIIIGLLVMFITVPLFIASIYGLVSDVNTETILFIKDLRPK